MNTLSNSTTIAATDSNAAFLAELPATVGETRAEAITQFCSWAVLNRAANKDVLLAVIAQMGGDDFEERSSEVIDHGIDGGFSGFISYYDTNAFYTANKQTILDYANEFAVTVCGYESAYTMWADMPIMKANGISDSCIAYLVETNDTESEKFMYFANNVAWWCATVVCGDFVDFIEEFECFSVNHTEIDHLSVYG